MFTIIIIVTIIDNVIVLYKNYKFTTFISIVIVIAEFK